VVATDLLTGVLVGLALTVIELLPFMKSLKLKVDEEHDEENSRVRLHGAATFVSLPRLTDALNRVPHGRDVELDLHTVRGIDHTTAEMVREWLARRRSAGQGVNLNGPDALVARLAPSAH